MFARILLLCTALPMLGGVATAHEIRVLSPSIIAIGGETATVEPSNQAQELPAYVPHPPPAPGTAAPQPRPRVVSNPPGSMTTQAAPVRRVPLPADPARTSTEY